MKVLDLEHTRNALPYASLIAALEEGFMSEYDAPLRHHHFLENKDEPDSVLLLMPAWQRDGFGGVKLVNVVPGNNHRSLAAISSSYVLFDRKTGQHLMIVDGGELTARRTAAASALAAKRLARPDSRTLLVVGAGRVARNVPAAFKAALPIERVMVFNRNFDKAAALVQDLQNDGFDAEAVSELEAGVKRADIISCATLSREPIVKGDWLKSGQHLDLIGSFTPEMRESDDDAVRRADVYIDTPHALVEGGDITIPMSAGVLKESQIKGVLSDMCRTGDRGRTCAEQITMFKSVGSAIEDLAAAKLAYATALSD
ncbi:ornithine cyclodeaminase family protein [Thalassospiraceae bacterium LMO-JJ14]|nr:ornithine cyclodeaminase family protein [Thalassospiraceae bacterium LMO-JJ14]